MALTDGLISYWKLDEASGNALDAHGSNELTDTNTVGSATGKINNCRDFDSSATEYFTKADTAELSFGDEALTLAGWVKFDSVTGDRGIIGKSENEYQLYLTSNKITIIGLTSIQFRFVSWGSNASVDTWYFVVGWHDPTNNVFGLSVDNGTPVTVSFSEGLVDRANAFTIGRLSGGSYLDGKADEWGLWDRVLTADERTSLYNGGNGFAYPFVTGGAVRKIAGFGGGLVGAPFGGLVV